MSRSSLISKLYQSALPSLPREPAQTLPVSLYRYIWRVSGAQQLRLCLLTLLIFPLTLAPLELQRRIVDKAIAGGSLDLLLLLGGVYFAVSLIRALLKFLRNIYMDQVAEGVIRLLRKRLAVQLPQGNDEDEGTRQSIVAAEAENVGGFVADSVAEPLLQAGTMISILGYMLWVEPLIALVALAFLVPSLVIVALAQPPLNRLSEDKIDSLRTLNQQLLSDESQQPKPDTLIERIYRLRLRFTRIKHGAKQGNNLINHLGPLSVLLVGGWLVIQGDAQLGTLVAFMSGYERMTDPSRDLLNFYRNLSLMRVQYRLVLKASEGEKPPSAETT